MENRVATITETMETNRLVYVANRVCMILTVHAAKLDALIMVIDPKCCLYKPLILMFNISNVSQQMSSEYFIKINQPMIKPVP